MRRDAILRQEEPILAGNLPPADLPNPYEPVQSENAPSKRILPWEEQEPVPGKDADDSDDVNEEQQPSVSR